MKLAEFLTKVVQTASITTLVGSYICAMVVRVGNGFMFIALVSAIVGLFSSLCLGLMGSRTPLEYEDASSLGLELKELKIRAWTGAAIVVVVFLIPLVASFLN